MNKIISRGNLYYADLNPIVGSEQGGIRPVLILQNNIGNKHSPTVIVAAVTSKAAKFTLPTHYVLNAQAGLECNSIVLTEQIRTIDKRRLIDYIGTLEPEEMKKVDKALAVSVGLYWSDIHGNK
ncbi:type II toxin-antitoxin system PemK/MazF family toxin [Eubacteriales bacterium OttesenSCG-928-G02]|nr:type II toxin-antitoxin system PemK/MazF family toxin [Eubacteriales bacterium OttesenSCG-928-G02]